MLSMTGVRANNNIRLTRLQTAFALNLPLNHFKFFKLFFFFFFSFSFPFPLLISSHSISETRMGGKYLIKLPFQKFKST